MTEYLHANVSADRVKDEGITFCRCYMPPGSSIRPTLANLILMTGRRWGAEETMATAKGPVGWDENQFRKWESMNHHTALAGIAMLRANMIQRRLDEIETGITKAPETAAEDSEAGSETSIPGPREPAAEFSDDDLRIPIGDSEVPVHAGQEIPAEIGFIRRAADKVVSAVQEASSGAGGTRLRGLPFLFRAEACPFRGPSGMPALHLATGSDWRAASATTVIVTDRD